MPSWFPMAQNSSYATGTRYVVSGCIMFVFILPTSDLPITLFYEDQQVVPSMHVVSLTSYGSWSAGQGLRCKIRTNNCESNLPTHSQHCLAYRRSFYVVFFFTECRCKHFVWNGRRKDNSVQRCFCQVWQGKLWTVLSPLAYVIWLRCNVCVNNGDAMRV